MKNQKGITLIALIITIIVLLILAGVSISLVVGQDGIIGKAQNAASEYELASIKEQIGLDLVSKKFPSENLTAEELYEILSKYGTVQNGVLKTKNGEEINIATLVAENGIAVDLTTSLTLANAPKLSNGMIPVKYDTTSQKWVICSSTDEEWYSYTTQDKRWANVMLSDGKYTSSAPVGTTIEDDELGSMFVWIPRFAYQITEGYHSTSGALKTVFLANNTNTYLSVDGSICSVKKGTEEGVTSETDLIVHPAFTTSDDGSYSNGEWKTDITGLWVAKFQAGVAENLYDSTSTASDTQAQVTISGMKSTEADILAYYPVFKGKRLGYNNVSISQCYDLSLALDDSGNPYGLTTASNSHLMKNSEWGAVAYLSISKYGYSDGTTNKEKYKNDLSISKYATNTQIYHPNYSATSTTYFLNGVTGYTSSAIKKGQNYLKSTAWGTFDASEQLIDVVIGSIGESYAWDYCNLNSDIGKGTLSSTTGNIYGIYDMGGCLADFTASYIYDNGETEHLALYASSFADGTSTYLATAYPGIKNGTKYDFSSSYSEFSGIFGDAIWETSSGTVNAAWFGNFLDEDAGNSMIFPRGGYWNSTSAAGLCGGYDDSGSVRENAGFHSVLVVE